MHTMNRRRFLIGGAGALMASSAFAQTDGGAHGPGRGDAYESLRKPGRIGLPEAAATQRVFDSPARKAASQGRWTARAQLPLPRSEMAWAVEMAGKMHLVGGYAEQR